jgi:hypothetical protein
MEHRTRGFHLCEALLVASGARFMEVQSSDALLMMLYPCGPRTARLSFSWRLVRLIRPLPSQFQEGYFVLLRESPDVFNMCQKQIDDELSGAISQT